MSLVEQSLSSTSSPAGFRYGYKMRLPGFSSLLPGNPDYPGTKEEEAWKYPLLSNVESNEQPQHYPYQYMSNTQLQQHLHQQQFQFPQTPRPSPATYYYPSSQPQTPELPYIVEFSNNPYHYNHAIPILNAPPISIPSYYAEPQNQEFGYSPQPQNFAGLPKHSIAWSIEDDKLLRHLKEKRKLGWREISLYFPKRTPNACQFRWRRIVAGVVITKSGRSTTRKNITAIPKNGMNTSLPH